MNRDDPKGDTSLNRWFRFDGAAGTRMADWCPNEYGCGAYASGWLNGNHPSVDDRKVDREGCFRYGSDCCYRPTNNNQQTNKIKVRNCGDYYVYELDKTRAYHRYCGNG